MGRRGVDLTLRRGTNGSVQRRAAAEEGDEAFFSLDEGMPEDRFPDSRACGSRV